MTIRYLHELGIVAPSAINQKGAQIVYDLQPTLDYFHAIKPSEYVSIFWDAYKNLGIEDNGLNGTVFELILACTLVKWEINPFFMQAIVQHVPNATFDLLAYDSELGPITLSAKTSLRERYKQSDLEAMALKQVHRRAQSHLITLNASEAKTQREKIKTGDISSLDSIVVATENDFDELITTLQAMNFVDPISIPPIKSGRKVLG